MKIICFLREIGLPINSIGELLSENHPKNVITILLDEHIIEIGTIILWIQKGIWWPFAIGMCAVLAISIWISYFYFKSVDYICPQCHTVFKPHFKQLFSRQIPNTRKLTCTACGHRGFCVETYGKEDEENK